MLLSPLPTLQKTLSPPPRLWINLLNAQKPDKREMEPGNCQFIKRLKKWFLLPRSDMLFSALTYHALRGCLYHTGTRSNETRKRGGEGRKRIGGNATDSLKLLV